MLGERKGGGRRKEEPSGKCCSAVSVCDRGKGGGMDGSDRFQCRRKGTWVSSVHTKKNAVLWGYQFMLCTY